MMVFNIAVVDKKRPPEFDLVLVSLCSAGHRTSFLLVGRDVDFSNVTRMLWIEETRH